MALIRLEVQNRLGDRSIQDGVVEYESDLTDEPKLADLHIGSGIKCLNLAHGSVPASSATTWIKDSSGEWREVL